MSEMTCTSVLLVDDNESDFELTGELLEEIPARSYTLDWQPTCDAGLTALKTGEYDVCLVDYSLGAKTGMEFLAEAQERQLTTPVVMLTGFEAREVDEKALALGAADYLVKDGLTPATLERALRYAIERGRLLARLAHIARYDSLTGIANRAHFLGFLEGAVARSHRSEQRVAVMLIDLDEFKQVNDTLGHAVGDQLLRHVGMRFQEIVRRGDLVARLGGDEFVIALDNVTTDEEATRIAEKVVATLSTPVTLEGHEVQPRASIGVAHYHGPQTTPASLVRAADMAMYAAKAHAGTGFEVYQNLTPPPGGHTLREQA